MAEKYYLLFWKFKYLKKTIRQFCEKKAFFQVKYGKKFILHGSNDYGKEDQ